MRAEQSIYITTGGGPGFMEAANKGAAEVRTDTKKKTQTTSALPAFLCCPARIYPSTGDSPSQPNLSPPPKKHVFIQVPGALTMGMGITLPFEDGLNPYVSEELAFEFHYFFTRKFWMVYHCQVRPALPALRHLVLISFHVHCSFSWSVVLPGRWVPIPSQPAAAIPPEWLRSLPLTRPPARRLMNEQALVVAPGGMGTLDELFEVLTLKQTGKVQPDLPVVLFGKAFWKAIINWEVSK